ncbi:MAG: hypothetical protein ACREL6_04525 [Gemmatimonadales bacterium]
MPRRTIKSRDRTWTVSLSGETTIYDRDEVGLVFTSGEGDARERRVTRFSPMGARSPELALNELSDGELRSLLETSQPAWTAPETGYRP